MTNLDGRMVLNFFLLLGILTVGAVILLRSIKAMSTSESLLTVVVDNARLLFGFLLLAVLFILAIVIAVGQIHEDTSFGLQGILESVKALTSFWAGWAFAKLPDAPTKEKKTE